MSDLFAPIHRMWLVRGAVAITLLCAVATWLATRADNPPAADPSRGTQRADGPVGAAEIAELARRATVQVFALDRRGDALGQGTGFFVSADGLIATNYHVIESARALRVQTLDGTPLSEVYLVAADAARDLAVLRVDRLSGPFLRVTTKAIPATGESVYVIGNPLGQLGTFSTGVVSATRQLRERELIQITAPISPGSSGGPVLNSAAEVIGVATLNLRDGQNMNFAVSARYLPAMMAQKDQAILFSEAARVTPGPSDRRTNEATPARSVNESSTENFGAEIDQQFSATDSTIGAIGYVPESRIVREYLEEGKANRHPVNVDHVGSYLVRAFCDKDCSQLALSIRDANDNAIDSDDGSTDHPMLAFAADESGRFTVRVTMVSCNVSPCAYGIRLYRATRRSR